MYQKDQPIVVVEIVLLSIKFDLGGRSHVFVTLNEILGYLFSPTMCLATLFCFIQKSSLGDLD